MPNNMEKGDAYKIENNFLKRKLDLNLAYDLAVRRYHDRNTKAYFLIVYVGSCRRRDEIIKLLTSRGLQLTKFKNKYRVIQKLDKGI